MSNLTRERGGGSATSRSRLVRVLAASVGLMAALAASPALAQDAATRGVPVAGAGVATGASADASTDASTDASADASAVAPAPSSGDRCVPDPLPADRAPTVTVALRPEAPQVGQRVLITYRFRFRARDRVEFDPDVVAFQQPAIELEYAREQPDPARVTRSEAGGFLVSEVTVAVQPFKVADVVVRSLPVRFNAGDEIVRRCTPELRFRVRSVFGNETHPRARDVTPPEDVRRDALLLRHVTLALDAVFLVVVGTLALAAWVRARPRKPVPPPPPRHPYLVASEALDAIARSDLLARGLTKDYYDAISDVVRRYVGAVRGFDAIEMTTDEVLAMLRRRPLPGVPMVEVERLLQECDLVKFARYVPSHEECEEVLQEAVSIVERGRPMVAPAAGTPAPAPPPPSGGGPR